MQRSPEEVWVEVLERISEHVDTPSLRVWFDGTRPGDLREDRLEVSVKNPIAKEYIESRFKPLLEQALASTLGKEGAELIISIENSGVRGSEERNGSGLNGAEFVRSARMPRPFKAKYTFDTFVIGAGNRFAHAAALAVSETPGVVYNPLFIYGGVGLGKTHLLHAVGQYVEDQEPGMRVRYVTCENFTNDFINSVRDNAPLGFQKRYRENDVLLIDDIQFLEGKIETQEAFFHTFNALYEENKQIVITSDRHPKYIPTLEDRLVSRFEWGLVTDIQPPDLETRIAILRKKALMDQLQVDDEVLTFIASKVSTNIRELEGALVRILAFAYPRQIAMYLSRELTDESLPKIGRAFGGRDHSTVMHATSKISNLINSDRDVFNQIHEITYHVKSKR